MDQAILVAEQVEAGKAFLAEFQQVYPIQAAFWLKEVEEDDWTLYVVSDQITDDSFDVAYGEVLRVAGQIGDPLFDPFQVKLIGVADPLARTILDLQQRHSERAAARLRGKMLGHVNVDQIYLYPLPLAARTN